MAVVGVVVSGGGCSWCGWEGYGHPQQTHALAARKGPHGRKSPGRTLLNWWAYLTVPQWAHLMIAHYLDTLTPTAVTMEQVTEENGAVTECYEARSI